MKNVEITYSVHRQKDKNGEDVPGQFKYSIGLTADGIFLTTMSFYGDEPFTIAQMERIKSAIESGKVMISLHR